MEAEAEPLTTRQKLSRELKEYLGLSVYLYICFGAIQLYKTALLAEHGISYEPYGFAAAKALSSPSSFSWGVRPASASATGTNR